MIIGDTLHIKGMRGNTLKSMDAQVIGIHNNIIIKWHDGRSAAISGANIWRMNGTKFTTLLTDIEYTIKAVS